MDTGILEVLDRFIAGNPASFGSTFDGIEEDSLLGATLQPQEITLEKPRRVFERRKLWDGGKIRIRVRENADEGCYVDEEKRLEALEEGREPPEPIPFLQWAVQIGPRKVNFYVRGDNPTQWRGKILPATIEVWEKRAHDEEGSIYFFVNLLPTHIEENEATYCFETFQRDPPPGMFGHVFRTHPKGGGFAFVLQVQPATPMIPVISAIQNITSPELATPQDAILQMKLQQGWSILQDGSTLTRLTLIKGGETSTHYVPRQFWPKHLIHVNKRRK